MRHFLNSREGKDDKSFHNNTAINWQLKSSMLCQIIRVPTAKRTVNKRLHQQSCDSISIISYAPLVALRPFAPSGIPQPMQAS